MKTAVMTGATSGIGQAIKQALEADGWKVVGMARHLPIAEQSSYEVDLSQLDELEPVATRIGEEQGPLDAFIHVAGVWHDAESILSGKKLHEFSTDQIVSTMNVGLTSAMVLSAKLLPFMAPNASMMYISGTFQDGGANWLPYYTSKRALEDFIVGLAADQAGRVGVYGVSPAPTATASLERYNPAASAVAQSPESVAKVCVDALLGRLNVSSGTIIEVRDGKPGMGYHR